MATRDFRPFVFLAAASGALGRMLDWFTGTWGWIVNLFGSFLLLATLGCCGGCVVVTSWLGSKCSLRL